jgi:hypothetical protein
MYVSVTDVGVQWLHCATCMYAVVTRNVYVYGHFRRGPVTGGTGQERATDAKEEEHSIVKNNTHRRSAGHTDRHFCQQDPIQMERGDLLLSCNIVSDLRSPR